MKTISVNGQAYDLHCIKGQVLGADQKLETTVSGGGGSTYNGRGHVAPITSRTTVHDKIFLADAMGKEHAFQLQDFNLACREGHNLVVVSAHLRDSKKNGDYLAVINQTTGQIYYGEAALTRLCKPNKLPYWFGMIGGLIGGGFLINSIGFLILIAAVVLPLVIFNKTTKANKALVREQVNAMDFS